VSNLNKKVYKRIDKWLKDPIEGKFVYVFLDGIWLKRCWAGEVKNVSVLVAIGVDQHGYRQVLGIKEGAKEDKESWIAFMRYLKERGLTGLNCLSATSVLGLVESLVDFYPKAKWQRCVVHFYRNVFTVVPKSKVKDVAAMLKAIHAQEDREAAEEKVICCC
jgi:putative transposase